MADIHALPSQRVGPMTLLERECYDSNHELLEEDDRSAPPQKPRPDSFHGLTEPERPKPVLSAGVRQMEAITMVWTKNWLIAAYMLITLISFSNSLQQQANFQWIPFAASSFNQHGMTALVSLVASIVSGVSKLPLATFINVCGRPQGFAICLLCVILGLIMFATCKNLESYAAAQTFYWVGMNGMSYVLDIFIADTSLMKNRLIWIALTMSPYICNAFVGPSVAALFLKKASWRWGYGSFAIITPIICIPFWTIFLMMSRRAKKRGAVVVERSGRTFLRSVVHWCHEFDVLGLVLMCAGFCCLLLAIGLGTGSAHNWKSPMITGLLIVGILCLLIFSLWEYFWAPKTFFPFRLLKDRSVVGACMMGFNGWITFYSYRMFYTSYLQVVFNLSVARAGYMNNIFSIVSCAFAVIIAIIFRYTDTYRWAAFIAMPIQLVAAGLILHFRKPGTHIGLLAMVEVLYAIGGAIMVQVEQIAVMTAVPHENLASGLALLAMITAFGGAVGQAISSAVWNDLVLRKLTANLPEAKQAHANAIFRSLNVQLMYPIGTEERSALIMAYADAQKVMVTVAVCSLVPCFLWIALLRDNRLSRYQSRPGLQA